MKSPTEPAVDQSSYRDNPGEWKGCPFCGADHWQFHFAVQNGYFLNHKDGCFLGGMTMVYLPSENERKRWNTRA